MTDEAAIVIPFPGRADEKPELPFWLTIAAFDCDCVCGATIAAGGEYVFRWEPKTALCRACADRARIQYLPSRKWKKALRRKREREETA